MVDQAPVRPLRFVVFGESIVSDWGNPVATSARAVLDALTTLGHEVTFLERCGNDAITELLRARGSQATHSFAATYPMIRARTFDLPRGWERTVWFSREVGTTDAVIALPGTPSELIPEIVATPKLHVAKFVDESFGVEHDGSRLVRSTPGGRGDGIPLGPAVTTTAGQRERSSRPLLVAYDDYERALSIALTFAGLNPVLISTGIAMLPGWDYVPEIELPELYKRLHAAVVIGAGDSAWASARALLPLASGCAALPGAADAPMIDWAIQGEQAIVPHQYEAIEQAIAIAAAAGSALFRI